LFEFTIPTKGAPQSPRSLAVSIAVHSLAVLLLFAIRFSGVARFPAAPEHFTLLAPVRETPIVTPKVRAPHVRIFRPTAAATARLTLPAAIMPEPPMETPKPVLPELPRAMMPVAVSIPVIQPSTFNEVKPAAPAQAPKAVVKTAGFESSETSVKGPVRRGIARSGFADASTESAAGGRRVAVASAAFGDTTVEKGVTAPRQIATAARMTPVEIVSKPRPAYTAEARATKIEGEVLLDVQFSASGDVRVLRVARGLGHGLDETAIAAAEGIRFRPATRDGAVVDSTALVHIVFQLAN
jgi:TonB family protein